MIDIILNKTADKSKNQGMGEPKWLWQVPILLILLIYLPAAILGCFVYEDKYAAEVFALLAICTISYYLLFPKFGVHILKLYGLSKFVSFGERISWYRLAWVAVGLYLFTLCVAAFTSEHTPLGTALLGGGLLDIARARAEFLATRQGPEALLSYSALILGKSVMPYIVLSLFYRASKWRYVGLLALLCLFSIGLEKSAPVFAFLPILLFFAIRKKWLLLVAHALAMVVCVAIWSFLAWGGLERQQSETVFLNPPPPSIKVDKTNWPKFASGDGGSHETSERVLYVYHFLTRSDAGLLLDNYQGTIQIINRTFWIPYITAYDWLRFQDKVLLGKVTLGQQIGPLSWLQGKPKLQLEQMVYDFQLGQPQAGFGAANTIFLADAKLAFGWFGVVVYSILFVFISAIIFSSRNELAKISSVTGFYALALSPLTASLLSGGLLFFMLVAMFQPPAYIDNKNDLER